MSHKRWQEYTILRKMEYFEKSGGGISENIIEIINNIINERRFHELRFVGRTNLFNFTSSVHENII